MPRQGHWAEEALDDGGDEHMMWYEGEEVDLSPPLRERLLLALPTLPLCRDDCRGLCARCGADLNAGRVRVRRGRGRSAPGRPAHAAPRFLTRAIHIDHTSRAA